MRIIAVENTADDLDMLKAELSAAFPGSHCDGFSDPLLAIKAYLESPPDFTVFCKKMRIIDGFTFARTIRSHYAGFTGVMLAEDDSGRRDAQNYFLEYLVKPADAATLRQLYMKWQNEKAISDQSSGAE